MAEVTGLRNNALPYPVYGAPYGIVFPILDADGDLVVGATGLDSEVSKNGDGFTDCTNEAAQIATDSGVYYLLLTGTEMTADVVATITKTSSSGGKTTTCVLYPRKLVSLATGTSQGGDTAYITLAAGTVLFNGQYDGCLCVATIDGNVESRILQVCTASNQQCTVTPAWNVAPDADDTYIIYLPEGMRYPTANLTHIAGAAVSTSTAQLGVNVVSLTNDAITAASINTGAFTADAFAANAIVAATLAADCITEAKIADNAIAAEHLAAGAIDFATFAADCKTGTGLKANVESISANAITATAINADAITSAKIADDAISSEHINTGAITADAFAADAIVAATLATGCLTADAFEADALVAATFATDCITADAIADSAIDAGAIAADAITAAKIADGAIDAATFAAGAITAAAIASNAIDADALAADAVDEIHDEVVEGTTTLRQAVRLILSVLTGKSSGGGTATVVFRDIGDTKDRISATVDANGNRTAVGTRDGS